MELSSQEEDIPLPINSSYGVASVDHGHMIHHHHHPAADHHNHIIPSSNAPNVIPPITVPLEEEHHVMPYKKPVRYKECLKNHAAGMGGTATDGCGEFMPSGEEGTLEALTCSACNCHRNFHRKETEGEPSSSSCDHCYHHINNNPPPNRLNNPRKFIFGHHKNMLLAGAPEALGYPTGILLPATSRPTPPHPTFFSYNMASESDEQEDHIDGGTAMTRPPQMLKKRFRTKFTQQQKDKMLNFAEKVGWKFQKQDEAAVQQFCQEIGVKRRVLKVWMHNNKHNLAKKNLSTAQDHQI